MPPLFSCGMKSERQAQKFMLITCHYPDLGSARGGWEGGGVTSLYEANGDVLLNGVVFSRLD